MRIAPLAVVASAYAVCACNRDVTAPEPVAPELNFVSVATCPADFEVAAVLGDDPTDRNRNGWVCEMRFPTSGTDQVVIIDDVLTQVQGCPPNFSLTKASDQPRADRNQDYYICVRTTNGGTVYTDN